MSESSGTIREHIHFAGRVQGVGFRYKATRLARHFGLTGWVRNENDGTVTGEFQGLTAEIDMVIQRLVQDTYICIEHIDRKRIPLENGEQGFSVRR